MIHVMIGKVIGTIIVISFFLGILYSIGRVREQGNEEQGNEEQGNKEQTQESKEFNTGSASVGTVELNRAGSVTRENCQHHVSGIVENNGNKDARNVILKIIFVNENNVPLPGGGELRLGNIPAGDQSNYEHDFLYVGLVPPILSMN